MAFSAGHDSTSTAFKWSPKSATGSFSDQQSGAVGVVRVVFVRAAVTALDLDFVSSSLLRGAEAEKTADARFVNTHGSARHHTTRRRATVGRARFWRSQVAPARADSGGGRSTRTRTAGGSARAWTRPIPPRSRPSPPRRGHPPRCGRRHRRLTCPSRKENRERYSAQLLEQEK